MCGHNHPSGLPKPSTMDDKLTKTIKDQCDIMQIRILDHIIIGNNTYFSYADNNKVIN